MCAAQVSLEKRIDNCGVMGVGTMLVCASTQQRSKRLPTWQHNNYGEGVRNKQKQIAGWQE